MGDWKIGTFGCFSDCKLCICSYFLPCVVFGQAAEKVGESCCMCGFCIMVPIGNIVSWIKIRGIVREKHGIEGSCCKDFICLVFCGFCSLVQLAHEVADDAPGGGQAMARE